MFKELLFGQPYDHDGRIEEGIRQLERALENELYRRQLLELEERIDRLERGIYRGTTEES